jgi:hypothetical protein
VRPVRPCSCARRSERLPAGQTQGKPNADLSTTMINGDNAATRASAQRAAARMAMPLGVGGTATYSRARKG